MRLLFFSLILILFNLSHAGVIDDIKNWFSSKLSHQPKTLTQTTQYKQQECLLSLGAYAKSHHASQDYIVYTGRGFVFPIKEKSGKISYIYYTDYGRVLRFEGNSKESTRSAMSILCTIESTCSSAATIALALQSFVF